jgi:hypothetical protein
MYKIQAIYPTIMDEETSINRWIGKKCPSFAGKSFKN